MKKYKDYTNTDYTNDIIFIANQLKKDFDTYKVISTYKLLKLAIQVQKNKIYSKKK